MKERPILLYGHEVRAILEGRKTQVRRLVKPQPSAGVRFSVLVKSGIEDGHGREIKATYGQPGDRLYVKEAWQVRDDVAFYTRADNMCHRTTNPECERIWSKEQPPRAYPIWKPATTMPRWASRITLGMVNVRVERLQEISEADAMAEGLPYRYADDDQDGAPDATQSRSYRQAFKDLWREINGKTAPWDSNPWVWVIEFKQLKQETP